MNRRTFFSGLAKLFVAGTVVGTTVPMIQAQVDNKQFKAAPAGRLLVSSDSGRSWQQAAKFGPDFKILGISHLGRSTYIQLGFGERSFFLKSTDGLSWHTADCLHWIVK